MLTKLLQKAGLLIGGGVALFAFLLVAQVNLDDLRHQLGNLLQPNDPTVVVGGLYVVTPEGHLQPGPPVCRPSTQLVAAHFQTDTSRVSLRNTLGYSVPLMSQLSAFISAATDSKSVSIVEISGHTLVLEQVSNTQLVAEDQIPLYVERLFSARPSCEGRIREHWLRGDCVALVHRLSKAGETVLGYTYNRYCMLPKLDGESYDRGPLVAPRPILRMTARLSLVKDFVGLISREVTPVTPASAEGSSSS